MVVAKLERANSRPIIYERGLIPAFKGVISYWMLYWFLISPVVLIFTGNPGVLARWQYASLIGIQAIALGLLFWQTGKDYLKHVYLPLILTITSLSFLVEKVWFLSLGTLPGASRGELLHAFAVRQDFALLLLIIAWQYKFRHAVFYVACISVTEWYLVFRADLPDHLGSTLNTNMLLSRAIVYLLLAYIITGLMQQQRQQQRELAQVNQQLKQHASTLEQLTVSRERNRLARELHDTLAHSLSALSVQLEATRSLWELDQAAAKAMLDNADKTTREGLEEARRALQALRASPLESLGFIEAIRELAEHAAQRADLKLQLDLPETLVLSQAAEQGIYRITQEALENVVRHAGASQLTLKLSASDKSLVLRIEDNGVGFDLEAIGSRCLGVKGMQERAVLLGAHLKVDSLKARGTTLTLGLEV